MSVDKIFGIKELVLFLRCDGGLVDIFLSPYILDILIELFTGEVIWFLIFASEIIHVWWELVGV